MQARNRPAPRLGLTTAASVVLGVLWVAVYLVQPSAVESLELRLTDYLASLAPAPQPSGAVVVVDIDDRSLAGHGQWPWPRHRLARLLDDVARGGARAIALDIVLAEPDQTSLAVLRDTLARELGVQIDLPPAGSEVMDNDRILAATLARGPFVLANQLLFTEPGRPDQGCPSDPLPVVVRTPALGPGRLRVAEASGALCSLPVLAEAGAASGFVNGHIDADGRLRRLPLVLRHGESLYPNLALAAVMRAGSYRGAQLDAVAGLEPYFVSGDHAIPLDGDGAVRIRFPSTVSALPRISADDVLSGRVASGQFRERIVFVGISAAGVTQPFQTPAGAPLSAAEVHARFAETVLTRAYLRRPDTLRGAELGVTLGLALLAGVAVAAVANLVTALGSVTLVAALWGTALLLAGHAGLLASPLLPTWVVVANVTVLLMVTYRLRHRDAQRRLSDAVVLMRRNEDELSSILGTIPDIVFRLDASGRITFISPAVSKYRARPEHLIGQPMLELVTPDDRPSAMWRVNERRTGPRATRDMEVRLLLAGEEGEGSARYFSVSAEGIYTADGPGRPAFAGTQGIARDVEDRRRLEAQLARAKQMEAMGTLAAGVAHDLNNILGSLVGYPELLLLDLPPDSPMRETLESIQASGQRAAAIVQDMLTIARRGARSHDVVSLNETVTAYLASPEFRRLQEHHRNVQWKTDLDAALMHTQGSGVHLSKVIMNMVANSAEAMPAGGLIRLTTRNCYVDQDLHAFERIPEGEYVVLSVIDDGVGIGAEHVPRIFEPFYSRKRLGRSGSGLGMAVVWSTVKDHGGFIDVHSREGEGTRFDLYFPVTRREPHRSGPDVVLQDYVGAERVLVVDDVPEQLTIAVRMLGKLGYDVAAASSGEQAVLWLQEHTADVVVLDMVMPAGIDGCETFRRIREVRPRQRAIIASGYAESDRVVAAQAMGAGAYVRKPYTLETIGMAVRREIDRPGP